ncbi:hypothetical protein FGK63_12750 [Ruegeria sediminis]|uniref:Bacteriophage tail tape measure N-terminal domain-containing protein n=1 Tax=Ruegeria sediminis TaxID=2583820 RepID=A0ABY2WWU6_9RHOB|nr:phage tail length tape measure family protein [Ruegeria sediminis]TMV06980.1 hypothetical protein FGK63_12750 [Ruegeria sediminis]
MAETHELRLKIDAGAAQSGARQFKGAIDTVRAAVKGLEKDSAGAFLTLKNMSPKVDVSGLKAASREAQNVVAAQDRVATASDRAAERIRTLAIQSANALRVSTDQASRLRDRLLSVGDTSGLAKLEAGLDRLRAGLTNATSGLDVRAARAGYADLASELNRTARESERLRAEAIAAARAEEEAANAARSHAAQLDALRAKYDSTYRISRQYEAQLAEIQTLENAGALSASRAAQAREQAAQSLLAAGNAADVYAGKARVSGHQTAYMAAQLNDVGVMLAAGQSPLILAVQQGTQISQMLNQMGDRASMLGTLRAGFMSMINPVSLATIGIIAGGAALAQWAISAFGAEDAAESFKRQLDTLSTLSSDLSDTLNILEMDAVQLAEKYGIAAIRVRELAIAQAELRRGEIMDALRDQVAELGFIELRYRQAQGAAALYSNGITNITRDFKISRKEAVAFHDVLMGLGEASTFEEQRAALQAIVKHAQEAGIELSQFPPELRAAAIQMIDLSNESDALQAMLERASDAISGATGRTNAWANAMSGVRFEIDAIASSLANIGGGVIDNAAKRAELSALQAGKSVKEAAVARGRFRKEKEWSAREQGAGWFERQMIDAERFQFEEGVTLDSQIDAAREAARKAASSSGKGSRVEALGAEERQLQRLIKEMNNRTYALGVENDALQLVASGQASSLDVAKLIIAAQREGAGAIDDQTAAMIRQYEEAGRLNDRLTRLAHDPVKDWVDSVPSWTEAGRMIEEGAIRSLSDAVAEFAATGKFDIESLGQSIVTTATKIIADMAVKELIGLLGGDTGGTGGGGGGFGLGDLIGQFFGGTAGVFHDGGISHSPNVTRPIAITPQALARAPRYHEGTPNTGLHSGEHVAVLRDSEAVIPLRRGHVPVELNGDPAAQRGSPVVNNFNWSIQTPDVESFRRSSKQIQSDGFSAAQRAAVANR